MAILSTVKVLEHCKVSPPSPPPPPTSIPLTFFDLPWLFFSPNQTLFFYEYDHPTSHFLSTSLPTLKHSLSLALQLFFPFSARLNFPPRPHKPYFVCSPNDHVSLTVAESTAVDDFQRLTQYGPRGVSEFHPLVPELKTSVSGSERELPLLSVQVTVFPGSGFCLGFAYHHVAADGRTFNNFIKTWSSLCRDSDSSLLIKTLPTFDRTVIVDRHGLEETFLNQWFLRTCKEEKLVIGSESEADLSDGARATVVVGSTHMDRIRKWILTQCARKNLAQPVHLSPYVLTCSFVWVCLVRTLSQFQGSQNRRFLGEDPIYFGFNAGGINRLDYPVPAPYFGNCIGFGRPAAVKEELLGEDGMVVAANAIGNTIKTLDKTLLGGAENWISDWEVFFGSDSDINLMVSGSPKVDLYKTDFGRGRPVKIEEISIDKKRGISLMESRDFVGGIEVGLTLPKIHMDAFISIFNEGLKLLE
ncbi:hypothetical protein JRO89_XS05G0154600 [Xanthoceras sorbifolium]|uniref:Anthocyanin 5-aromatic acyltransferase n=1 Tax=Xanthoceras sorbifolium TaxID=99658 RepID=A0ABQ8I223_9ROSI|nr:hypothetical protein JRO89_XS05G0154600 [Xanthoceras sorbifolium]